MSQSQENVAGKFVDELTDHLKENKFKEALNLFESNNYDDIMKQSSWDIVPIVSSYLTTENAKDNRELIDCCTSILNAIAQKCNPSEVILELLEQVESPENVVKFCIILKVLTKSLSKMTDKTTVIEWCISTIRSYVESLAVPDKESQCIIATIAEVQDVYTAIVLFLEPLVNEIALENEPSDKCAILRDYVLSILIFLMGKPLCHFEDKELDVHLKQTLPETLIIFMSNICGDLLWFLNIIDIKSKSNSKNKSMNEECHNLTVTLFELNENVPDLAYANFYFYIITKENLWEKMPQIYDYQYIFQTCTYLIIKLLQEQESITTVKGLTFMEHLLKRVTRRSLTSKVLELNTYSQLLDAIVNVMIYCDSNKERKRALHLFKEYIELFDMQARYFIVLYLYETSEHSGLLSLTTNIFKSSIIECLKTVPPMPHFLGKNLESLLKLACKLPHGALSDLVELSDEIITSLNLLRFLFIRDTQNQTGVWNLIDQLENEYLKPLRSGIDLCKTHWKLKMKDLEKQKKTYKITENIELERNNAEVTLSIGGEELPAMPVQEKISFCYQAVNGLDVMESILIRVNECIADNPHKKFNNSITTSE